MAGNGFDTDVMVGRPQNGIDWARLAEAAGAPAPYSSGLLYKNSAASNTLVWVLNELGC